MKYRPLTEAEEEQGSIDISIDSKQEPIDRIAALEPVTDTTTKKLYNQ
jgi:hypothetical protein